MSVYKFIDRLMEASCKILGNVFVAQCRIRFACRNINKLWRKRCDNATAWTGLKEVPTSQNAETRSQQELCKLFALSHLNIFILPAVHVSTKTFF